MQHDWKEFFPYPKIRKEQEIAIDFALDSFIENSKKYVVIEAGTGVGKSAIGFTIAQYFNSYIKGSGTYYLTTQKVLQKQYVDDFKKKGMKSLQSSSNFQCKHYKGKDCSTARKELKVSQDSKFKQKCSGNGCVYRKAKQEFIQSDHGVTNFSYFLAETHFAKELEPRTMMVVDECHNTEVQLGNFIEISISEHFANQVIKIDVPDLKTQYQVLKWVKEVYRPKLNSTKAQYAKLVETLTARNKINEFVKISSRYELIEKHLSKLSRFIETYHKDNWVLDITETNVKNTRKFEFKPICVGKYSDPYLFRSAEKILLMSASVMNRDAFCESLGLETEDVAFISIPSPFPVENRPIIVSPVASMSYNNINEGLPRMAKAIKAILDAHPDEKGIIHCHSYKIAKYLEKNIRSKRILSHNSYDREKKLKKHIKDSKPTVLLSPSMQEGVDLKGDLSRFQIICKIPYPYLGDKLVKKRMNKWKWWYPLQTAKTIVQSVGRSVRSDTDTAVTYILDSDWDRFWSRNKNIFPDGFKDALK
jgi:ATP-dependent DNA helicase DinG